MQPPRALARTSQAADDLRQGRGVDRHEPLQQIVRDLLPQPGHSPAMPLLFQLQTKAIDETFQQLRAEHGGRFGERGERHLPPARQLANGHQHRSRH